MPSAPYISMSHIDTKGCPLHWMYTYWQKHQYITPWDENGLDLYRAGQKKNRFFD